jgi:hypothetical protein
VLPIGISVSVSVHHLSIYFDRIAGFYQYLIKQFAAEQRNKTDFTKIPVPVMLA